MSSTRQTSSRVAVTIRATVMLGCLIFIPAVALFRTPLSDLFHSVFGHEPAATTPRTGFVPPAIVTRLPPWPDDQDQSHELTEAPAFVPASVTPGQPHSIPDAQPRGHLTHASQITQVSSPPLNSVGPLSLEDMEKELQQFGATYYFLEHVAQENRYRFFCRVQGADRPFEAWGTESRATMLAVVRQIADWRAARRPVVPLPPRSPSSGRWGEVGRDMAPSTAIRPRSGRSGG